MDIALEVSVASDAAEPERLNIRLVNRSKEALQIKSADLPWGNRYSMILVAVQAEQPNRQIAQQFSLDDPESTTATLAAGSSMSGSVALSDYFSSLETELGKGALIALWSYRLMTADGKSSRRLSGWVEIGKRAH